MGDLNNEIIKRIGYVTIPCDTCSDEYDEESICTVCWCKGGQGDIDVLDFLGDNIYVFEPDNEVRTDIFEDIKSEYVDCPDCGGVYSDDQYTCTTCWCEGGQGKINVIDWLKDNTQLINK